MLELFICCSSAEQGVAEAIASRLKRAEVHAIVDADSVESVASRWEGGLSSTAILVILSPDAVPPRLNRSDWERLLNHVTTNSNPRVVFVLVRDCPYPRLLNRKYFFSWNGGSCDVLRRIEACVMDLHTLPERRMCNPARLPSFAGRGVELSRLWESLVDKAGTLVLQSESPCGKTSLAQEFAGQASANFRDILWIPCGSRSAASITSELAAQLAVNCEGPTDEVWNRLLHAASTHRVLLVFDDFHPVLPLPDSAAGNASFLVTTRVKKLPGKAEVLRLEEMPLIALVPPSDATAVALWRAMAVCRPTGFSLDLAREIAELPSIEALDACDRLIDLRLADPLDVEARRYRISAQSRAAITDTLDAEKRRHSEVVNHALSLWNRWPDAAAKYLDEVMPAFHYAADADWTLARTLSRYAHAYMQHLGRQAEVMELVLAVRDAAESHDDWKVSDECAYELSWARNTVYRGADHAPLDADQLAFDFSIT